jgi:hypothetical protein
MVFTKIQAISLLSWILFGCLNTLKLRGSCHFPGQNWHDRFLLLMSFELFDENRVLAFLQFELQADFQP